MNLKAKLISTIAAVCLVICLVSVGIWAAGYASIKIGGSVIFDAEDVSVKVVGSVSGNNTTKDEEWNPVAFITPEEEDDPEHEAEWTNLTFNFAKDGSDLSPIVIKLTITNFGSIPVNVYLVDEGTHGKAITVEYSNDQSNPEEIAADEGEGFVTITITAESDAGTSISEEDGAWTSILHIEKVEEEEETPTP